LTKFSRQEDINERLLAAITTDLIDDTENVLDFLAYMKEEVIMTRLIPIKKIIAELKEAVGQLTKLHFPFKI